MSFNKGEQVSIRMSIKGWSDETYDVLDEVGHERCRQDARWGEQNHPTGASADFTEIAEEMRKTCDIVTTAGVVSWLDIASEEFWEAFSEEDPVKRRVELVQLAAVIVAAIESEDRRAVKP